MAWEARLGLKLFMFAVEELLDWQLTGQGSPFGMETRVEPGGTEHFPAEVCAACPLRDHCTSSSRGRSVSIHPNEARLRELRKLQLIAAGRTRLRERVAVEHTLAHLGYWQGRRARYLGGHKNLFDLRSSTVVHNLHVLARLEVFSQAA